MTTESSTPVAVTVPTLDAVGYRRAHSGKLMIISREAGKDPAATDYFKFDSVGTHPTGLFVTGIFDDGHRGHMKVSAVRDANEVEIAWRRDRVETA